MPIFQHPTRGRVLFIHIPKTAGSSVEKWLQAHGFELEKLNNWDGTHAQHATKETYDQWGEFDYKFTIVREPLARFVSSMGFRGIQPGDADRTARDIIQKFPKRRRLLQHWSNHLTPQIEFLDDDVEIFRFEQDFSTSISEALELPGPLPHENPSRYPTAPHHLTIDTQMKIIEIYKDDYEALGYPMEVRGNKT